MIVVEWKLTTFSRPEPWLDAPLRCARSDGRPHSCVVARPTTAPDAKTWSIPTIYVMAISVQAGAVCRIYEYIWLAVRNLSAGNEIVKTVALLHLDGTANGRGYLLGQGSSQCPYQYTNILPSIHMSIYPPSIYPYISSGMIKKAICHISRNILP